MQNVYHQILHVPNWQCANRLPLPHVAEHVLGRVARAPSLVRHAYWETALGWRKSCAWFVTVYVRSGGRGARTSMEIATWKSVNT